MAQILSNDEVRKAIFVDFDFDEEELKRYADLATSFLKEKTGRDFSKDATIEPLAKQCAVLYIRQQYFGSTDYNKDHDYSIGITGILVDLQNIAFRLKKEEEENEAED